MSVFSKVAKPRSEVKDSQNVSADLLLQIRSGAVKRGCQGTGT
jgi:hypothetical protein